MDNNNNHSLLEWKVKKRLWFVLSYLKEILFPFFLSIDNRMGPSKIKD